MKVLLVIVSFSIIFFLSSCSSTKIKPELQQKSYGDELTINEPVRGVGKCSESRRKARENAVQDARIKYAYLKETTLRGKFESYEDSNGRVKQRERYQAKIDPTRVTFSHLTFQDKKIERWLHDPKWCVIVIAIPY
jgi:hypothetical protein